MEGTLIEIDPKERKGKLEQNNNKRVFEFDISKWDGDLKDIELNIPVTFTLDINGKVVESVKKKEAERGEYEIVANKSIPDCIYDHYSAIENTISKYREFIKDKPELDFLRIRRFLLSAYNQLTSLDPHVANPRLQSMKNEILRLFADFEEFIKKSNYPPQYSFEKIFLNRQIEYVAMLQTVETTQSIITSTTIQERSMSKTLKQLEESFAKATDKGTQRYSLEEKHLKSFRKRYVDTVDYLGKQRVILAKSQTACEDFSNQYFQEFCKIFIPLVKEIKSDFLLLLNTKAYELDRLLWDRAKGSTAIRRFFIKAGIYGTYSSKTFLKYFLRSLDHDKIRGDTNQLVNLLKYLEGFSRKNILLLRESIEEAKKFQFFLSKFDEDLQITVSTDPRILVKFPDIAQFNLILMDKVIKKIDMAELIPRYLDGFLKNVSAEVQEEKTFNYFHFKEELSEAEKQKKGFDMEELLGGQEQQSSDSGNAAQNANSENNEAQATNLEQGGDTFEECGDDTTFEEISEEEEDTKDPRMALFGLLITEQLSADEFSYYRSKGVDYFVPSKTSDEFIDTLRTIL